MVLVPLVLLANVHEGVPGAGTRAAAVGTRDVRLVALERVAVVDRASRSRVALLPREDTLDPTTTTSAPSPTTTAAPRSKPKPAPVVKAAAAAPKPAAAPAPAPKTAAKPAPSPPPAPPAPSHTEEGGASYYSPSDPAECAHRTAPMGTVLTVTNLANGKSVTCKVGDRGPFVDGRVIDLSKQAFASLASTSTGVIQVRVTW